MDFERDNTISMHMVLSIIVQNSMYIRKDSTRRAKRKDNYTTSERSQ